MNRAAIHLVSLPSFSLFFLIAAAGLVGPDARAELGIVPPVAAMPMGDVLGGMEMMGGPAAFGGGAMAMGGGGNGSAGEAMADAACRASWDQELRRRAAAAPPPNPFGGTATRTIPTNGQSSGSIGLTSTSGTDSTDTAGASGTTGGTGSATGADSALDALGLGDLAGSLSMGGDSRNAAPSGSVTTTTTGSGGTGGGSGGTGTSSGTNSGPQLTFWQFYANCIREVKVMAGENPQASGGSSGGSGMENLLLLQLLSGGEESSSGNGTNFYSDLPANEVIDLGAIEQP